MNIVKFSLNNINETINKEVAILKLDCKMAFVLILSIVIFSIAAYAVKNKIYSTSIIDDTNRHLIGTEVYDTSYIIFKNGVYKNEKEEAVNIDELSKMTTVFPKNRILQSSKISNFIPSSVVEVPIKSKDNIYIAPNIILVNNSLCVLTKSNGNGWNLTENSIVTLSFEKYKSNIINNQRLIIGYIKDGVMFEGDGFDEKVGEYRFIPSESDEYYFYILSSSSDYLSLKESILEIQKNNM